MPNLLLLLRWNDPLPSLWLSVRHFATDREIETHPGPRPCQYCRHIHYHPSFSPPHTSHFLVDSSSQDPAAIINIRGVRLFTHRGVLTSAFHPVIFCFTFPVNTLNQWSQVAADCIYLGHFSLNPSPEIISTSKLLIS